MRIISLYILLILFASTSVFAQTDTINQELDTLQQIDTLNENIQIETLQVDTAKKKIFVFKIYNEIGPESWRTTQKSFKEAYELNADLIILHLNTYGGLVDAADSIRTKILNSRIPVYVFIDNNAASAGALISLACDKIYMRPGANIGAATVVNQTGEAMPDKYQSYMRSTMRSTAEAKGKDTTIVGTDTIIAWKRNPLIAEAMVDPRTYIEGVIDTGKVLTFTSTEAMQNNYCEGEAIDIKEILKLQQIENYEIVEHKITQTDKLIGFLINPALQGILIMIIIGGIYFELQTPGIGFPIAASIFAAVIYFSPLYVEGIAENWEIILFMLGLILVAVEVFAIPGFGIVGGAGIILIISGLTLSMIDNIIFKMGDSHAIAQVLLKSFVLVITSFVVSLIASIYLGKKFLTSNRFSFLVLNATQEVDAGFVSFDGNNPSLIGKEAISFTVLRPSGKIELDNEIYDAVSLIGFIDAGKTVKIEKQENGQLYVIEV